ncbi:NAD(P)-binding protein [Xylaria telfairii]|nr:NAD(P)-binding protein [Xylaria telfairii]
MSSQISTTLPIGATSGIGETLTHLGRDRAKLAALAAELNGLETRHLDLADIASLPATVTHILKEFPTLDTVFINGEIQKAYDLFNTATTNADQITHQITVNLTAPNMLTRLFAPHLLTLAKSGSKTNIFITSSSIAYIPLSFYPTYCATKARLDHEHRELTVAIQGGKDKAFPPMEFNDYIDQFFTTLEQLEPDGSIKKEIGVGFGEMDASLWRGAFEKVYEQMRLTV